MPILRVNELRSMENATLKSKLSELRNELRIDKGSVASGGKASNPGRMKELRKSIARILTVLREKKIEI
ncbi:50S ribosomal protein L29 [Candidatus Micrarchaeota archaeon]|nr:50S ribosomal protein L29 [Candidatus Micrarchaeota archaeon]